MDTVATIAQTTRCCEINAHNARVHASYHLRAPLLLLLLLLQQFKSDDGFEVLRELVAASPWPHHRRRIHLLVMHARITEEVSRLHASVSSPLTPGGKGAFSVQGSLKVLEPFAARGRGSALTRSPAAEADGHAWGLPTKEGRRLVSSRRSQAIARAGPGWWALLWSTDREGRTGVTGGAVGR